MEPRPLPDLEPNYKCGGWPTPNLFKYFKFPTSWKDFFFGGEFWSGWIIGLYTGFLLGQSFIILVMATVHFLI